MFETRKLKSAIRKGHSIERVKELIRAGANINARVRVRVLYWDDYVTEKEPLLIYALRFGRQDIALCLIENGCDIHARTEIEDESPLKHAVRKEMPAIVKALLDNGADVSEAGGLSGSLILLHERAASRWPWGEPHDPDMMATPEHDQDQDQDQDRQWSTTRTGILVREVLLEPDVSLKEYFDFANRTYTSVMTKDEAVSHHTRPFEEMPYKLLEVAGEAARALPSVRKPPLLPAPLI